MRLCGLVSRMPVVMGVKETDALAHGAHSFLLFFFLNEKVVISPSTEQI